MADDVTDDVGPPVIRYTYRQKARPAAIGMMIGPPIFAAVLIAFFWKMFWTDDDWIVARIFAYVFLPLSTLIVSSLALAFFIYGLRRMLYGGAWGCIIDAEYLTWTYPERTCFQGQSLALREVRSMQIVAPEWGDGDLKNYIVMGHEKFQIHADCFGRHIAFIRALLQANPFIEIEIIEPGRTHLGGSFRREIEALWAEARVHRTSQTRFAPVSDSKTPSRPPGGNFKG